MTDSQEARATSQDTEDQQALDISLLAAIEVTSEDELFPIEQAFRPEPALGWRAAAPGVQTIRLVFREPQRVTAVRLHVVERAAERRQAMILRMSTRRDPSVREIARREFTFSPSGLTDEIEEIPLLVDDLTVLDLTIDPDHGHAGEAHDIYATLTSIQLILASSSTAEA